MNFFPTDFLKNFMTIAQAGLRDWGSLHPLIIHFPLVLLCIAPAFILLGIIYVKSLRAFCLCSLLLLWLGTAAIFLAVETGEAASKHLNPNSETMDTLITHANLADQSRLIFIVLTILWTLYVAFLLPPSGPVVGIRRGLLALFLLGYFYGLVFLLSTAHYGGKLVHHHGIHSNLYENPRSLRLPYK